MQTLPALFRSLLVLLGSVVIHSSASACKCAVRTTEEKLAGSSMVFRGRVVDAVPLGSGSGPAMVVRYRFDVAKIWKGAPRRTVEVSSGSIPVACGMTFDVGSEYVIYAYGEPDSLGTGLCAGNFITSSSQALQVIEELDRLAPASAPPGRAPADRSEQGESRRTTIGAGVGVAGVQTQSWQIGPTGEIWGRYAFTPRSFVRATLGYAALGENPDADLSRRLLSAFFYGSLEAGFRFAGGAGSLSPYLLLGTTVARAENLEGDLMNAATIFGVGLEIPADDRLSLFTEVTAASTFSDDDPARAFRTMLAMKAGAGWSF